MLAWHGRFDFKRYYGIVLPPKYWVRILKNAPIAQPVEQLPFKEKVLGSIPSGRTTVTKKHVMIMTCFLVRKQTALLSYCCASRRHVAMRQSRRGREYLLELEAKPNNSS